MEFTNELMQLGFILVAVVIAVNIGNIASSLRIIALKQEINTHD